MSEEKISVKNISKDFKIGFKKHQGFLARFISFFSGREPRKVFNALNNVSFEAHSGDLLGVIGDNGSGKSTLLRIISGIYKENTGDVFVKGRIVSLINLSAGLKDRLTMRDNIFLIGSLFGLTVSEIKEKLPAIVGFSGLDKFLDTKVYQFSNGMLQRLVFSVAINCDADILLLDEIFEVGDEDFKKKSSDAIKEVVRRGGCVLLVSHDLELIKNNCNKVCWVEKGEIRYMGEAQKVIDLYLEHTTKDLLLKQNI